jgi:hypothetical protein
MQDVLRAGEDAPLFEEIPVTDLRDAMRDVVARAKARGAGVPHTDALRHSATTAPRPPTIVGVCVHCDEVIRKEDVRVKTPQGTVHGRCTGRPTPTEER